MKEFWRLLAQISRNAILPTIIFFGIRSLLAGDIQFLVLLQIWIFTTYVLLIAAFSQPSQLSKNTFVLSSLFIFILLGTVVFGVLYRITENTFLAWIILGGVFGTLLGLATTLSTGSSSRKFVPIQFFFALAAGLIPVSIEQIETRFSSEEFFAALVSLELIIFWGILSLTHNQLKPPFVWPIKYCKSRLSRTHITLVLQIFSIIGLFFVIKAYQTSFYPSSAPGFPGISQETPFICGSVAPSTSEYEGEEVFRRLVYRIESKPQKASPAHGMLALTTGNGYWAQVFRSSLLEEANQNKFTDASGSVKYDQFLASRRAYYYSRVRDAYPGLFRAEDQKIIQNWFAEINRRVLTVEWVDYFYGVAYKNLPQGPYINQETGSGLLSLLENSSLGDPHLSTQNQGYLAENIQGWSTGFRVTDDAAIYQTEWIENALFQSLYSGIDETENMARSFEWIKLLAPPDGSPIKFNHIRPIKIADISYLGVVLLRDPELVWLAGRSLDYLENNDIFLSARPGSERGTSINGKSPTSGSCLVFGNSGVPNQVGPLAPDKIVFRSGWETDDVYMLMNLRFTGWHRYKATNNIIQIYHNGPLLVENSNEIRIDWLPKGRSLFRDKRIPRENLNGLVIEKRGISRVLHDLTGIGSIYTQDPPYYAEVTRFETDGEFDISTSKFSNWHGWAHERTVYFHPDGVIVIHDSVEGDTNITNGLVWHFNGGHQFSKNQIHFSNGKHQNSFAKAIFLPLDNSAVDFQTTLINEQHHILRVQSNNHGEKSYQTATILLLDEWSDAQTNITRHEGQNIIEVRIGNLSHKILLANPNN
jgi:hypothetical protein